MIADDVEPGHLHPTDPAACLVNAVEGWWPICIGKNDSNEHGQL